MKKIELSTFLLLMLVISVTGCNKDEEDAVQKQIEQITQNLSDSNELNPELLVGTWKPVKFAYTADGKQISDITALKSTNFIFAIPTLPTSVKHNEDDKWSLACINTFGYTYSLNGNLIELKLNGSTYIYVIPPHEEHDVTIAISNARSLVVKGNELIIYFTKVKDKKLLSYCTVIEDKNLLILKKVDTKEQDESEIPFVEYLFSIGYWPNINYDINNNIIIVNNSIELEKYLAGTHGVNLDIDFSKNTLLLVSGTTPRGIQNKSVNSFKLLSNNTYKLDIEILLNDATVVEHWVIALITGKLSDDSKIEIIRN